MQFKLPMNEIAVDFYDALKSISSGYASFDYEENGYEPSDIVKVFVLPSFSYLLVVKIHQQLLIYS